MPDIRTGLNLIRKIDAKLTAVSKQMLKARRVLRRGNDENIADARKHQRRKRIINHRLVINRQKLLARNHRQRVQPRAGAAGENNSLHFEQLL